MNQSSISIYIYIYKISSDLIWESMKRIEIFLNHIRDKNKFKSRNSLFPFVGVKTQLKNTIWSKQ